MASYDAMWTNETEKILKLLCNHQNRLIEEVHTTVEQNTLISSIISHQQPLKPATVVVTLHYLGLKPTTKEMTSQHNVTREHNTK